MTKPTQQRTERARRLVHVEDYEPLVGAETVDRILEKAEALQPLRVAHVNSTFYGGGVAELLDPLTLLMNSCGLRTEWHVIQGAPDFFSVTKKMHNAMQGASINLTDLKKEIYEDIAFKNSVRIRLRHFDRVVIHDPQPLPMIRFVEKGGPWIWRCHIDVTRRDAELWAYLKAFVEAYDAVVFSIDEHRQEIETPQRFMTPAINPFSIKNKELSEAEIEDRLEHYDIPDDLPLVVQISRFDRWKDPQGVIDAFKIARKEVDATLVLLGNVATDDPEGKQVYESLLDEQEERIIILSEEDTALVNALQRRAAVVLQKSLREGFGLTVTEAMWKGAPVIGGRVGGIRHQITDGENGYLVDSVEEAAARIVELIQHPERGQHMGERARTTVRERYLLTHLLENYLDLFGAFETQYHLAD